MRKLRTGLNFPLYIRHALPTHRHEKSGLGARTQDPNIKSVVLYLLS